MRKITDAVSLWKYSFMFYSRLTTIGYRFFNITAQGELGMLQKIWFLFMKSRDSSKTCDLLMGKSNFGNGLDDSCESSILRMT